LYNIVFIFNNNLYVWFVGNRYDIITIFSVFLKLIERNRSYHGLGDASLIYLCILYTHIWIGNINKTMSVFFEELRFMYAFHIYVVYSISVKKKMTVNSILNQCQFSLLKNSSFFDFIKFYFAYVLITYILIF